MPGCLVDRGLKDPTSPLEFWEGRIRGHLLGQDLRVLRGQSQLSVMEDAELSWESPRPRVGCVHTRVCGQHPSTWPSALPTWPSALTVYTALCAVYTALYFIVYIALCPDCLHSPGWLPGPSMKVCFPAVCSWSCGHSRRSSQAQSWLSLGRLGSLWPE